MGKIQKRDSSSLQKQSSPLATLQDLVARDWSKMINGELSMQLAEAYLTVQRSVNLQKAVENRSKTLKAAEQKVGKTKVIQMLCVAMCNLQNQLGVEKKMGWLQLAPTAEMILEKYPHETYQDFIVACKEGIMNGTKFYNTLTAPTLFKFMQDYLERKYQLIETLEQQARKEKQKELQELESVRNWYKQLAKGEWKPIKTATERLNDEREKNRKAHLQYLKESGKLAALANESVELTDNEVEAGFDNIEIKYE